LVHSSNSSLVSIAFLKISLDFLFIWEEVMQGRGKIAINGLQRLVLTRPGNQHVLMWNLNEANLHTNICQGQLAIHRTIKHTWNPPWFLDSAIRKWRVAL
jgi:hypothetical protein